MPLRFLVDENLHGPFWNALSRAALTGGPPLDVLCVGEPDAPALGTLDPPLLAWIERNDRILITRDKSTMPGHLSDHLAGGGHCPGVFMIREVRIREAVEYVCLASELDDPDEWRDRIQYVPG